MMLHYLSHSCLLYGKLDKYSQKDNSAQNSLRSRCLKVMGKRKNNERTEWPANHGRKIVDQLINKQSWLNKGSVTFLCYLIVMVETSFEIMSKLIQPFALAGSKNVTHFAVWNSNHAFSCLIARSLSREF